MLMFPFEILIRRAHEIFAKAQWLLMNNYERTSGYRITEH